MNIFKKLFLVKEIKSKTGIIHFRRWRLLSTFWFKVYIHEICKADEDSHLHDHPWNYISIGLKGRFIEKTELGKHFFSPLKIVKRKAEQFHCIHLLLTKKVFTLFIAFKRRREWGYNVDGTWVDNISYRQLKNSNKL